MSAQRIIICDKNLLVREGIKSILRQSSDFSVAGEAVDLEELLSQLCICNPNLLIIDPASISDSAFVELCSRKGMNILCISETVDVQRVKMAIARGIHGYVFKDCDRQEIIDAVVAVSRKEKFFCGKALEVLENKPNPANCQPVKISDREAEIVRLIAEGLTNKEIADRLCLSSHTITTHRKNIMTKLGLANTASLVLYAIRENLVKAN